MATRNLILDGVLTQTDILHLGADDALPETGTATVPLTRWLSLTEDEQTRIGVRLSPSDDVRALTGLIERVPLLAIEFPKFVDGRGYSLARIAREQLGYRKELRAIGDVLRDQIFYLHRCGFNAFEVPSDKSATTTLAGLADFSITYQGAADDPRPIYRRA